MKKNAAVVLALLVAFAPVAAFADAKESLKKLAVLANSGMENKDKLPACPLTQEESAELITAMQKS